MMIVYCFLVEAMNKKSLSNSKKKNKKKSKKVICKRGKHTFEWQLGHIDGSPYYFAVCTKCDIGFWDA